MSSIRTSFRRRYLIALHYALRILIVATPVLILWNQFGMDRSFTLDPRRGHDYIMNDDRVLGGSSVSRLQRHGQSATVDCTIGTKFAWPYCSLAIQFAPLSEGVDFSDYHSVTLDIDYSGPGPNLVRFYMRNYEEELSNTSDPQSLKVNGIEFEVPTKGELTIPMKSIQVASWWVANRKIALQHTDMRVDNVPYVEVSTATQARPGTHRLEVKAIRFNGKLISEKRLLAWITRAWMLFGICRLIVELLDFRDNLRITKRKVSQLVDRLRFRQSQLQVIHRVSAQPSLPLAVIAGEVVDVVSAEEALAHESVSDGAGSSKPGLDDNETDTPPAETSQKSHEPQEPGQAAEHSAPPYRTSYLKRITTMVGNSLRIIPVDDILYFQSDQKYTRVVTAESEVLIKKTLKDLLAELDPEQFWRVHRSIVVNALEVVSIEPDMGNQLTIKLKNRRERLPVSDTFVKKIRQMCV